MRTKSHPKPREFKSDTLSVRATCSEVDGERVVDTRIDLFDGKHSASELRRYAKWLVRASRWVEVK